MEVSESNPVPNLCNDNTNPQLGLQSSSSSSTTIKSDLDRSPSDLDHTAELVEECQNLDLGDAEEKSSNKEEEEEGSNSDDINKNVSEVEDENENENEYENENQIITKYPYPVRPDAEDCAYYMKNGCCKFGSNCKFNHPARRKSQVAKEKVKETEELAEKPGQSQIECKYYLKTGGCKFGKACRFSHTRVKSPVVPILELNFLGLPIRPGEKECPFYMRNGSCKYGSNCRFNHPDPTAVGGSDSPSGRDNDGSISSQVVSQTSLGSWSSPMVLNETPSFVQMIYPPSQVAASQKAEWNGYQGPLIPPERSINPTPAYAMKLPVVETNVYTHQQQQMLADEFPERPGQPDCSYFLKTGDCKFRHNCKYHHPKNRTSKSQPCALSDKGLPLRPGQNICSHYSRYGICKFGPACKFDHPVQLAVSSTESGVDSLAHFGNSATVEETGGSANGTDNQIHQPV